MRRFLSISSIVLILAGGLIYWRLFSAPAMMQEDFPELFEIPENFPAYLVAQKLEQENFIRSDTAFRMLAKWRGLDTKIQPGKHQLSRGMNVAEILQTITGADRPQISFTVPEGFSTYQIDAELASLGLITAGEFSLLAQPDEGYLFPDTYFIFSRDFEPQDLIKKMKNNFLQKMAPLFKEIEATNHKVSEIITMASILEREVRTKKDFAIVSGILWKRLANEWPLQTDATLLYGRSTRTITKKDLTDEENPYNTYTHRGLPPTPIGNPGLAAIRAAIHPEESPYWFYLTDSEGTVHYARTNEEQNANRRKYL